MIGQLRQAIDVGGATIRWDAAGPAEIVDCSCGVRYRPGDAAVSGDEDVAITEIDAAIGEIKRAAIDDGKNVADHPNVDVPADRPGHLHKALELLRKVHSDVAREEDDPVTRSLRDRAVGHIDGAIHATEVAVRDVRTGR